MMVVLVRSFRLVDGPSKYPSEAEDCSRLGIGKAGDRRQVLWNLVAKHTEQFVAQRSLSDPKSSCASVFVMASEPDIFRVL